MIAEDAEDPATADEPFQMTANVQKAKRIGSSEYESLARAAAIELYPDVNPHAMALCFNLIRAANRMTTDMEVSVHRPMGISFAGYRLLVHHQVSGTGQPKRAGPVVQRFHGFHSQLAQHIGEERARYPRTGSRGQAQNRSAAFGRRRANAGRTLPDQQPARASLGRRAHRNRSVDPGRTTTQAIAAPPGSPEPARTLGDTHEGSRRPLGRQRDRRAKATRQRPGVIFHVVERRTSN